MLTYALDKDSRRQPVRAAVPTASRRTSSPGRLAAGEKLPSKRALAAHLEVSVITVKNAYEQLMAEGYLYRRGEAGLLRQLRAAAPALQPPPVTQDCAGAGRAHMVP